jgi:hypothetical protein
MKENVREQKQNRRRRAASGSFRFGNRVEGHKCPAAVGFEPVLPVSPRKTGGGMAGAKITFMNALIVSEPLVILSIVALAFATFLVVERVTRRARYLWRIRADHDRMIPKLNGQFPRWRDQH